MKPVFVDTSYYVALLNAHDQHHRRAVQIANTMRRPLLITEFVLLELGNYLSRGSLRQLFIGVRDQLRADAGITIVPVSSDLLESGCALYSRRPDKTWSVTDCISFVVMADYGVTDALTTDRHFEQAGFEVLLK
jgi:uncharacterized protein